MARLLLVEGTASFTEDRTKVMDACRRQAPSSYGWWPQHPAASLDWACRGLTHLQEADKEGLELLLVGLE